MPEGEKSRGRRVVRAVLEFSCAESHGEAENSRGATASDAAEVMERPCRDKKMMLRERRRWS